MPYIKQEDRDKYDKHIDALCDELLNGDYEEVNEGHLNYIITKLLDANFGGSYSAYNTAIGILECAKLEYYRRSAAPYEDKKIVENGDVYTKR